MIPITQFLLLFPREFYITKLVQDKQTLIAKELFTARIMDIEGKERGGDGINNEFLLNFPGQPLPPASTWSSAAAS